MTRGLIAGAVALGGLTSFAASMPLVTAPPGGARLAPILAACTPVGNASRVIADCTIAIKIAKRDDKSGRAAAYFNRGGAFLIAGDNDRAIVDFSASIALDATHSKVFNNRALAYDAKGDVQDAIADFDRALRLEPDDPACLFGRGKEYAKLGEDDKALADFDRTLKIAPSFPFAYLARAHIRFVRRDVKAAGADVAKYRELMPADPEGAKAEAALKAQSDTRGK